MERLLHSFTICSKHVTSPNGLRLESVPTLYLGWESPDRSMEQSNIRIREWKSLVSAY